ncbi:MAG: hypothetical protein DRP66_06815 [Planctomycetota bacterium]|nr:MAG: hypothetical protein DRP66_06815 [Planctomycetota bacterium]
MELEKYSMGIGDRFCRQGKAQLDAIVKAKESGIEIVPVWNKSHREHGIIGTVPADTRLEADAAVRDRAWSGAYYVDADHINLSNVDLFVDSSDFFTLDVADYIGQAPDAEDLKAFVEKNRKYVGSLEIAGIDEAIEISRRDIERIGGKFLLAVKEAGKIYRHIEQAKGKGNFITEVSVDESNEPQSPVEMLFILSAIADEGIPAQTIAPKFTGRFNKGVDYVGDALQFAKEFNQDIAVINFAIAEFALPANLKLSIHSGSDKFSIYAAIRDALQKFDAGVHLKTAGTTWLEELIGLAMAEGEGLEIAKDIYAGALARYDELCKPYATVIDIDKALLPTPDEVGKWAGAAFAAALRHDQSCAAYNLHFRQMLHLSYKIAAEMQGRFLDALAKYEDTIAPNVSDNIYERHIRPVFGIAG